MVKGVNKTVIEVNNTGSKYFEKIVFYVTPQYGNLSAKQLKKAATNFSFSFDTGPQRKALRRVHKARKIRRAVLACAAVVAVAVILLIFLI